MSVEEAVRAALDAQVAAWNAGDVDAFCAAYAEDAVYVGVSGVTTGRAALAASYRARYPDRAAMGVLDLAVRHVHAGPGPRAVALVSWSVGAHGGAALVVLAPGADGAWRVTHDATLGLP